MDVVWQTKAWDAYLDWQQHDKKILLRINELIKEKDYIFYNADSTIDVN